MSISAVEKNKRTYVAWRVYYETTNRTQYSLYKDKYVSTFTILDDEPNWAHLRETRDGRDFTKVLEIEWMREWYKDKIEEGWSEILNK